ncbi:MAG: hypothetical protein QOH61_563 [Chloroflexota bacterium]|nr:hypothetical protein [Chloroflexota bacterium]
MAVGPIGDRYEREADSVSQRIASGGGQPVSAAAPSVQRATATPASVHEQEKEEEKEKREKTIQRSPASDGAQVQLAPIQVSRLPDGGWTQREPEVPRIGDSEIAGAEPPEGTVAVPGPPVPSAEVPPTETPGPGGLEGAIAGGVQMPATPEPGISEDDLFAVADHFEPVQISPGGAISEPAGAGAAAGGGGEAPAGSGATGGADGATAGGAAAAGGGPAAPAGGGDVAQRLPLASGAPAAAARPAAGPTAATASTGAAPVTAPPAAVPSSGRGAAGAAPSLGPTSVAVPARGFGPSAAELESLRRPSGGELLPAPVRDRVGAALGVDLAHVRVHRSSDHAEQAARLGARAFTLGAHVWLGKGERPDDVTLMAHELTHVVQQGHAIPQARGPPTVRGPPTTTGTDRVEPVSAPIRTAELHREPPTAAAGIDAHRDRHVAADEHAPTAAPFAHVVVPGHEVPALPGEAAPARDAATDESRHAAPTRGPPPLDHEPATTTPAPVSAAPAPEPAQGPVSAAPAPEQVQRGIRDLIPDSILNAVARIADRVPGYRLLAFAIGENPVTGVAVPRTGESLLNALEPLLPDRVITALRESGSADKAVAWFTTAIATLNLTLGEIVRLLGEAWDRVHLLDSLESNIQVVVDVFGPLLMRIRNFIVGAARTIFNLIFEAALAAAGSAGQSVIAFFRRVESVLGLIVAHPGRFVSNMLSAVGGGLKRFVSNIGTHLRNGFVAWLTGPLTESGITFPDKWDLRGIIGLALQLLGLTWANIRRKLVKQLDPNGDRKVTLIEKGVALVKAVIEGGMGAILPFVLDQLSTLLESITSGIVDFVIKKIAIEALGYLSGLLSGGLGTLLQIAKKIYDFVIWALDVFQRVQAVITTVLDAMERIALGNLEPAAQAIEATLARFVPILIGMLAGLLGLGDLPKHIRNLVQRLSRPVDRMLDRLVGWIVGGAKRLLASARTAAQNAISWFRRRFTVEGAEPHTISFSGPPPGTTVTIESVPTEITRWLSDKTANLPAGSTAQTVAADVLAKIDDLKAVIAAATAQDAAAGERIAERTEGLVRALQALLTHLGAPSELPLTNVAYEGAKSIAGSQVAAKMTVAPLTAAGPMGSVPSETPLSRLLARRRTGDGSFWIQGHLLNENLHGPGIPQNLTPISRSANARHLNDIERLIKTIVSEPLATAKQPPVLRYEVEATYGASRSQVAPPGTDPQVLETLEAERQLADRFVCHAWYMSRNPQGEWVADPTRPLPLANGGVIENDVPTTPFSLGEAGAPREKFAVGETAVGGPGRDSLRTVAGLPDLARTDDRVADAVLRAASGKRSWAALQADLATALTALSVAQPASVAESIRNAMERDPHTVLYRVPGAPAAPGAGGAAP